MPRNGSGNYTLPQSAFVPNTTISSAAVNSDLSDIAAALTGSVAADGQTPITGPIRFQSGTAAAPGVAFVSEVGSGLYLSASGVVGVGTNGVACALFDGTKVGTGQTGNQFYYANGAIPAPVGAVINFAGTTAPTGWLLLSGANISRTSYPELFQVIGTQFGSGDGSTTYGLPDARGRFIAGRDDMGGSAANRITSGSGGVNGILVGAVGGAQAFTMTTTQMPSHAHGVSGSTAGQSADHSHTTSGSSQGESAQHNHTVDGGVNGAPVVGSGASFGTPNQTINTSVNGNDHSHFISLASGGASADHTHGINFSSGGAGSGAAFSILPPTIIMNKIIFAGRP